ncbi:MAG: hypothetical protein ACRCX2_31715 [Paraclostridium sp.]
MSNVISRTGKRTKKKEEAKLAAQILAIKQLVAKEAYNTMRVLVTLMFPRLKNECGLDYTTSAWLVSKLVAKIPENEELFVALSETISSEGRDGGYTVSVSPEKLNEFVEKCSKFVTFELCKEMLDGYNAGTEKLETAIGAAKIMNERAGQEFEVVSNGDVEIPTEKGE